MTASTALCGPVLSLVNGKSGRYYWKGQERSRIILKIAPGHGLEGRVPGQAVAQRVRRRWQVEPQDYACGNIEFHKAEVTVEDLERLLALMKYSSDQTDVG